MITAPIMCQKEPIGVIMALNKQGADEFSKSDQEVSYLVVRRLIQSEGPINWIILAHQLPVSDLDIYRLDSILWVTVMTTYNPLREGKLRHFSSCRVSRPL